MELGVDRVPSQVVYEPIFGNTFPSKFTYFQTAALSELV